MAHNEYLGENIRFLRTNARWTQDDLGKKVNAERQTISNWECGNVTPSISKFEMLLDLFACSADFLLGRERDKVILESNGSLTNEQKRHLQYMVHLYELENNQKGEKDDLTKNITE